MINRIVQSYQQGFQVLHKNFYLFWINLAYLLPAAYLLPKVPANSWLLILVPFITITLKLADTKLLFELPQKSLRITETYVVILYRYFLRVFFLSIGVTILGLTIYVLSGGDFATLLTQAQTFTSPQATLLQKLTITLPLTILLPIIPFFKIFWVVKKQSFFKSVASGFLYAYKHLSFAIIPFAINTLLIIIQYPLARYLNNLNPPIFMVINIYLGLVMTSASIVYFKSHKNQ